MQVGRRARRGGRDAAVFPETHPAGSVRTPFARAMGSVADQLITRMQQLPAEQKLFVVSQIASSSGAVVTESMEGRHLTLKVSTHCPPRWKQKHSHSAPGRRHRPSATRVCCWTRTSLRARCGPSLRRVHSSAASRCLHCAGLPRCTSRTIPPWSPPAAHAGGCGQRVRWPRSWRVRWVLARRVGAVLTAAAPTAPTVPTPVAEGRSPSRMPTPQVLVPEACVCVCVCVCGPARRPSVRSFLHPPSIRAVLSSSLPGGAGNPCAVALSARP